MTDSFARPPSLGDTGACSSLRSATGTAKAGCVRTICAAPAPSPGRAMPGPSIAMAVIVHTQRALPAPPSVFSCRLKATNSRFSPLCQASDHRRGAAFLIIVKHATARRSSKSPLSWTSRTSPFAILLSAFFCWGESDASSSGTVGGAGRGRRLQQMMTWRSAARPRTASDAIDIVTQYDRARHGWQRQAVLVHRRTKDVESDDCSQTNR